MNKPKVSVIVTVYNTEKYLPRLMDSLLNQTLKDIEIILVDDESPDHCPAMCDEYAKQYHKVRVIHKKNEGCGYARNSGIELATGEFIAFVDSDDFVDVLMYEKLLQFVEKNQLDTCFCRFQKYYPSGRIVIIPEKSKTQIFKGRMEIDRFLMEMIGGEEYGNGKPTYSESACKALYSTDIIRKYQISFISEKEIASEDLHFNIDYLSRAEKVCFINEVLYSYFNNTNSITTLYSKHKHDKIKCSMKTLSNRLSIYYPYEFYRNYYFGQLLRLQKVIFMREVARKDLSYFKIRNILKKECDDPMLYFLKKEYSIKHLPLRKKIYIFTVRHKLVDILFLLIKFKSKI